MEDVPPPPDIKSLQIRARLAGHAEERRLREEARRAGLSVSAYQARRAAQALQERLRALDETLSRLARSLGTNAPVPPQDPPDVGRP